MNYKIFAEALQIYDTMLLQLDSDYDGETEYEISWGDTALIRMIDQGLLYGPVHVEGVWGCCIVFRLL